VRLCRLPRRAWNVCRRDAATPQKALQRRVIESLPIIAATRGLCNSGRLLATDDPEALGVAALREMLASQGIIGFRVLTLAQYETYIAPFATEGFRIDTWDVFMASADQVRGRVEAIVEGGLPDGLVEAGPLTDPEGEDMQAVSSSCPRTGLRRSAAQCSSMRRAARQSSSWTRAAV